MKIEVSFDPKYQIQLYINMAKDVSNGFFGRTRAVVLPYDNGKDWYLPDYKLFKDKEYVGHLSKYDDHDFLNIDEVLFEKTKVVFDLYPKEEEFKEEIGIIERDKEAFLKTFEAIFDLSLVEKIVLIPSLFDTNGAFSKTKLQNGKYILYASFKRSGTSSIPSCILGGYLIIVTELFPSHSFSTFVQTQSIISFLDKHSKLSRFFKSKNDKVQNTIELLNEDRGKYVFESAKYMKEMGIEIGNNFTYDEQGIYFNGRFLKGLQKKEADILKLLIDNNSKIVTFDMIADTYWKEQVGEKFSIYGIAKIIEKLRKSLRENDIKVSVISTVRKRGYMLLD